MNWIPISREKLANVLSTFVVFLMVLSLGSLRKLHAAGQPVLELFIDAVGASAMFALFVYFFGKRS